MLTSALRARGLTRLFGGERAVDGLDLDVRPGEVFGLLGPNGAGKTTSVRMFATLLAPSAGRVEVLERDVERDPGGIRARIGYVPQEVTADRNLTGIENLRFFGMIYGLGRAEVLDRAGVLLGLLGLEGSVEKRVRDYSGGMRKKLDLACGLLHSPEMVLLDEPTLGLDVGTRRAVWDYILALKGRSVTVLLCTNLMEEADRLCDRLAIIDRGRVAVTGSPEELKRGLGGDVVTLECAAGEGAVETLAGTFRALPMVRSALREGARLHATVDANETALPALAEAARRSGVELRSLSYSRPGLEEVFLRHTGRRFAEGDAPSAAGSPR